MKKEAILTILKNAGIELEAEKEKEFLLELNKLNDADIQNAKKDYTTKETELADLKAKYESDIALKDAELKKFQEGGENYIDKTELDELRTFKNNTIAEKTKTAQANAIEKLVGDEKYKFDKKSVKLISIATKDKFQFNEQNEITNVDEVMAELQKDYADYIVTETVKGANPTNVHSTNVDVEDDFVKGFKSN